MKLHLGEVFDDAELAAAERTKGDIDVEDPLQSRRPREGRGWGLGGRGRQLSFGLFRDQRSEADTFGGMSDGIVRCDVPGSGLEQRVAPLESDCVGVTGAIRLPV